MQVMYHQLTVNLELPSRRDEAYKEHAEKECGATRMSWHVRIGVCSCMVARNAVAAGWLLKTWLWNWHDWQHMTFESNLIEPSLSASFHIDPDQPGLRPCTAAWCTANIHSWTAEIRLSHAWLRPKQSN